MSNDNEQGKKESKGVQYVQLAVILVVLAILAYLVISFLMKFIWWILGLLSIFVLIINYKTVFKVFGWIKNMYKKNTWLGVGTTIGAFLLSTPFVGYLFLKTIWDFRKSDMVKKQQDKTALKRTRSNEVIDIEATEIPLEEREPPTNFREQENDKLPPSFRQ